MVLERSFLLALIERGFPLKQLPQAGVHLTVTGLPLLP